MSENRLSISKAARLAGISRTAFYKNYLNQGKISKSKDARDRVYIEMSELLRVFPEIESPYEKKEWDTYGRSETDFSVSREQGFTSIVEQQKQEIQFLKQTIEQMKENEIWLKSQIEQQKLIENTKKRSFLLDVIDAIKR